MKTLRSIAAFFSGYVVFGIGIWLIWQVAGYNVCTDVPPTGFYLVSLFCECGLGFGAGMLVGWIAGRRECFHALVLAGFFFIITIIGLIFGQVKGPVWPHLGFLFLVSPAMVFGGYLLQRNRNKKIHSGSV